VTDNDMYIGLMLINQEDDILDWALQHHAKMCDWIYVLDGTEPNTTSHALCQRYGVAGYLTDAEVGGPKVCGMRQHIHQMAVNAHGPDNWFLILHADERWPFDPRDVPVAYPDYDGFGFRLPFYVPRDPWDDSRGVDQLHWRFEPGWPEFRMFHGSPNVAYDRMQYMNTQPSGLQHVAWLPWQIEHYPYRSRASQQARAAASFDPANYAHVSARDAVVWDDDMVAGAICEHHRELVYR
jgi:hypothetical protein